MAVLWVVRQPAVCVRACVRVRARACTCVCVCVCARVRMHLVLLLVSCGLQAWYGNGAGAHGYHLLPSFPNGAVSYEVELKKLPTGFGMSLSTTSYTRNGHRHLEVTEIVHGSPAALCRVIRPEDVLVAVDRFPLRPDQRNMPSVAALLRRIPVGSSALFTFRRWRGGAAGGADTGRPDQPSGDVPPLERFEGVECEAEVDGEERSGFVCLLAKFGPPVPVTAPLHVAVLTLKDPTGCTLSKEDKAAFRALSRNRHVAVFADRGLCYFHLKALVAQRLGAVALIVGNNQRRPAEVMTAPNKVRWVPQEHMGAAVCLRVGVCATEA